MMENKDTILAVDDNNVNLVMLRAMLSQYYNVVFASDGDEALLQANQHSPDLILLDVMMPKKDGFTTCRELKSDPVTKDVPIIFLTARSDSDSIVEGLNAGAADYVCKPFSRDELLIRIKHQVDLLKARRQLADQLKECQEQKKTILRQNKLFDVASEFLVDAVVICDPEGKVISATRSCKSIYKIDFDMTGQMLDCIACVESDKKEIMDNFRKLIERGEFSNRYIVRRENYNGTIVLESSGKTIRDDDGNVTMAVICTRNVTQSARSDAKFRKSLEFQKNLRLISQNVSNIHSFMASCTYLVNSLMKLVMADEVVLLLGRKDKWTEFFYHSSSMKSCRRGKLPPASETYPQFVKTLKEKADSIICNIQTPLIPDVISSRSQRYIVYPLIFEDKLVGIFYVSRTQFGGITQENVYAIATVANLVKANIRKKIYEKRIKRQEKEISGLFKYSANGIVIISKNLELRRYNRRFLELFNITDKSDLAGRRLDAIIKGEPLKELLKLIDKVGKPPLFETASLTLSDNFGSKKYVEATVSKIPFPDDVLSLMVFTDVTDIRNMDSAIMKATTAGEEKERTRLAAELHDGLGALLSSINIYLNLILSGGTDMDELFRTLKLTKDLVQQAISSVKEIANNLHPVILSRFGLVATINNIIEGLENSRLIKFGFSHSLYKPIGDKNLELFVYRIVNELINNTMKHAHAKNVAISLVSEDNHLLLEYADDGQGFDIDNMPEPKDGSGRGLQNIMGRVKSVNGKVQFKSKPNKGLMVAIELPIVS